MSISLIIFISGCLSISPELEWEDVETDHEPVLNVLGILSVDTLVTSFIRVHRSLRMDEASDTLIKDPVGNIYYASRYVIRDAQVIVSNNGKDYLFEYDDFDLEAGDSTSTGAYVFNGDSLNPYPGEIWTLSISTPGGLTATGETTIPPSSQLFTNLLPDTFQLDQTMDISWQPLTNHYQIMSVANSLSYIWKEDNYNNNDYGLTQEEIIGPGEESWTLRKEFSEDGGNLNWDEDWLLISLMSMDENYYDFFFRYADDSEYSNIFLGEGGSGQSFGIEEGIGVFGSIGIDRHTMPIAR
jgi:hypothetical protein